MRTIIICLLLILIAGCSTSRKLTTSTVQRGTNRTVSDTREQSVNHKQEETDAQTLTGVTEAGDMEITRREYDTALPVDSVTGKPPLKNETVIRSRSEKIIRQEQATKSKATGTDSTVITDNTRHNETAATDTRTSEKQTRHPPWWLGLLIGGVIFAAYRFARR